MKITDLLKKLSLPAVAVAFALPTYASLSDDELDVVVDGPKVVVLDTINAGPFTISVIETTLGEKSKRKMTMTRGTVEQVVVNVEGFVGKHSYFREGDGELGSSNGLFSLGGVVLNLNAAMVQDMSLSEAVETQVTPLLKSLAESKERAYEIAEEKALEKKAYAEEQEELARQLAEEEALAKKLAEEEALALKLEAEEEALALRLEAEEARRLEEEALRLAEAQKETVVVHEEDTLDEGDDL
ncbi:MAG: hypothetical protein GW748_04205 [Alphaproteobacteria bacterium]|nr:hypothetical protein [Alphaproteobacteria bacterium]NCQ66926.1 hypothetical protein [Alphaproteobacteria bacterium]NCT07493.1 hypothetical protein [Alphaproteobacteria bacterium]